MEQLITNIALAGMYFLGIGLTSLVAKLVQRRFLNRSFKKSSWQPITGSTNFTKMY